MGCTYNGASYSEGALICQNGRELKCSGDEWHETGYSCSGATLTEYYKIGGGGLFVQESNIPVIKKGDDVVILNCVKFVQHSNFNEVKVYNNCASCMIVTINWSNKPSEDVRVNVHSFAITSRKSNYGEIVGDRPC